MKQVSIVIPSDGQTKGLETCLQALSQLQFPTKAYEVIVVEDGDCDRVRRLVESWPGLVSIRYLSTGGGAGPAAARNLGWRQAQGEVIAFTDAHCQPAADWLVNGLRPFQAGADGVSGRIHHLPVGPARVELVPAAPASPPAKFSTMNCFYRRTALAAVNGFDEQIAQPWQEDSDLYFRLLKAGYVLVSKPDVRVLAPAQSVPWRTSLRQQRKGMFAAYLYKKHPRLYRQKLQTQPPWRDYLSLAILLATLAVWAAHQPHLALFLAGIWAGLSVQFTFQQVQAYRISWSSGQDLRRKDLLEILLFSWLLPAISVFWRLRGAVKYQVFFL